MSKLLKAAILGAPASGKGTISSRIIKTFDFAHVSTGDIFRQNIKEETELGKSIQKFMSDGQLVPDDLVMKIILAKLKTIENKNWLWDGFPRTINQAKDLFQIYPLDLVINLIVPTEVIIDRVKGRMVHIPSGRVYNTDFNPPKVPWKDDITGEPLVQRPDDKPEAVKERLKIYAQKTEPMLNYYKEKKILKEFRGNTSDEIWPNVKNTLLEYMKPKS